MPVKAPAVLEKVYALLARTGMLHAHEKVLVAVSGGPDSVCLLQVLLEHGFHVEVAHFDHQTRSGGSASDARFVHAMCEALNVPFHQASAPVAEEAAKRRLSFEQCAREYRYHFFVKTARDRGCTAVALGHHAGDQAETVLMRVIRGTTPRGLAGIRPFRSYEGIHIVRPLLDCTREEILHYLHERGFAYRLDITNDDTQFLRNRIRHELIPLLERDYNEQVEDALERLADSQRCENALIESLTEALLDECIDANGAINRAVFRMANEALQRRAVVEFALAHGVRSSFENTVDAVRFIATGRTGEKFDLGGLVLRNARTVTEVESASGPEFAGAVELPMPGEIAAFGLRFTVRTLLELPPVPLREYCTPARQVFDAAALRGPLILRTRRPGDRFAPFGLRGGSKKVKEYFIELGLSLRQKNTTPILLTGDTILWIVGHAIGDTGAVKPSTKRCIEVTAEPCDLPLGLDDETSE